MKILSGKVEMVGTPKEIVQMLKLEDWTRFSHSKEYMFNVRRRITIFNGERIVYKNEREFLNELNRLKIISILEH